MEAAMPLFGILGGLFGFLHSFPTCGCPGLIPTLLIYLQMCFVRHGYGFAPPVLIVNFELGVLAKDPVNLSVRSLKC